MRSVTLVVGGECINAMGATVGTMRTVMLLIRAVSIV